MSTKMSSSTMREMIALVLQFLDDAKMKETMHKLEQESGFFFNMDYFEKKVIAGEWNEVETYLSGFSKVDDNNHSKKTYFEIRKHRYLEALDRDDKAGAIEILSKDLKVFSRCHEEVYKELTNLLTLHNFRDHELLSMYGDTESARNLMLIEVKKMIKANPLIQQKLVFPPITPSRLLSLINQGLNWQHDMCKNPRPIPKIHTLLTDHICAPPNQQPPVQVQIQNTAAAVLTHVSSDAPPPPPPLQNTPTLAAAIAAADRPSTAGVAATTNLQLFYNMCKVMDPLQPRQQPATTPMMLERELPKTLVCSLQMGTKVTCIDFNPSLPSLLAIGNENGAITVWEAALREKLAWEPFEIWNVSASSDLLHIQDIAGKEPSVAINRVAWSPERDFIGVAFSRHLIHLFVYQAPYLHRRLEIDAHNGGVNDLVFYHLDKELGFITCGDDKLIKVWNMNGQKLNTYESHRAPVYSICPYHRVTNPFLVSTSLDGQVKQWTFNKNMDYDDAPGKWCTRMRYSADGYRLFSCGTSKDGESFLVEWNAEGKVKRTYSGFRNNATCGIVQFDTAKNRYLAAGEDNQIKFWDMDKRNVVATTDAEGSLCSVPFLRFNKDGNLLAVTTSHGGLKILANVEGAEYLRTIQANKSEASSSSSKPNVGFAPFVVKTRRYGVDLPKSWKLTQIVAPSQCRTLTMPGGMGTPGNKVVCLLYANSGASLLALGSKGTHKMWKWMGTTTITNTTADIKPSQTATLTSTSITVAPQPWIPKSGLLMTHDIPQYCKAPIPYMALTKNEAYLLAVCGGKISLFNLGTFKVLQTFMQPPPAATFFAFHPDDNNIIAVGTDASTIHIYDFRNDVFIAKLISHQKHITGLAFSAQLRLLVSSSADGQLIFWNMDSWDRKNSLSLQMVVGNELLGDTRLQFHSNQVHLLVCHPTQIAIYDASRMEWAWKWKPQNKLPGSISCATLSCNSELVYVGFTDGFIGVFDTEFLRLRCYIAPYAYLQDLYSSSRVHPTVIRAHPVDPNKLAIGLADGSVRVIEPSESEGSWGK